MRSRKVVWHREANSPMSVLVMRVSVATAEGMARATMSVSSLGALLWWRGG